MKYHVAFNVMCTVQRFVEADDDDQAVERAAEAEDSSEDFHDCDWQTEWVHPEWEACREPGKICWEPRP